MVQLPNPGKLRPAPPPPVPAVVPVKLEIEDHVEDQHAPPSKRSKASTSFHQVLPYDLLEEPSPLGLRLRKSPSLLDLIQMRLSQADYAPSMCMTSCDNAEVGGKKDLKSTAVSVTIDKMKASNFPASFLRIGTWECVSRYEGDLVAKCYFAKHKIVWEVLEGGLKSKIEIQWSDITALKATSAENVPDTLDIVLARQPLFFRETNPQPRKHTLWQATSDFTGGQASINRRHFLQCAQGLLCKHFEKLLQCDPRLDALSRQPEIILDSPYFDHRRSVFDDKNESKCHTFDDVKDICGSTMSEFQNIGSSCAGPSMSSTSGAGCPVARAADGLPRDAPSTSVTNSSRIAEEKAGKGADGSKGSRYLDQLKVPGLRTSMSMCDLMNHIEHCISGQKTLDNPFLSADGSPNKDMLDELAQYLLSDSLTPSAPDEQFLMSRVNSLYCLLQKDNTAAQSLHEGNGYSGWCHDGADVKPDPHPVPASERKPVFNLSTVDEDPDDASGYEQPLPRISRKESFGELLMHLPRIASLPQVLFNITGDPKSKAR